MPATNQKTCDHRDAPTYWFAVLEIAKERNDFARAAQAQRELRRLGITVRYGQRRGGALLDTFLRGYTTADAARLLRVSEDKIRAWIRTGELVALNTASTRSGKPRFVILPEAIQQFAAARSAAPPPKSARRKKRTNLVDFYPD